jgi:hypothetical protein
MDPDSEKLPGDDLVVAIHAGDLARVRSLLALGADPNGEGWVPLQTPWGPRPGSRYLPVILAAERGNTGALQCLIDAGADANVSTEFGSTPILKAAMYGHLQAVKLLVANGACPNVKDEGGLTPERAAKESKHHDVVEYLRSLRAAAASGVAAESPRLGVDSFNGSGEAVLAQADPQAVADALAAIAGATVVGPVAWGAKLDPKRARFAVLGLIGRDWAVVCGLAPGALDEASVTRYAEQLSARCHTRAIAYGYSDTADALLLQVFNDGRLEKGFYAAEGGLVGEPVGVPAGERDYNRVANAILTDLKAFVPAIPIPMRPLRKLEFDSLDAEDVAVALVLGSQATAKTH